MVYKYLLSHRNNLKSFPHFSCGKRRCNALERLTQPVPKRLDCRIIGRHRESHQRRLGGVSAVSDVAVRRRRQERQRRRRLVLGVVESKESVQHQTAVHQRRQRGSAAIKLFFLYLCFTLCPQLNDASHFSHSWCRKYFF